MPGIGSPRFSTPMSTSWVKARPRRTPRVATPRLKKIAIVGNWCTGKRLPTVFGVGAPACPLSDTPEELCDARVDRVTAFLYSRRGITSASWREAKYVWSASRKRPPRPRGAVVRVTRERVGRTRVQGHYILNVYIVEFAAKQYCSGELAFAAQTRAH